MNTTEDNKLIAEFIGEKAVYNIKTDVDPMGYYDEHDDKPNFHSSWDWLMPVVGKIERLSYEREDIYKQFDRTAFITFNEQAITVSVDLNGVIEDLVQFIKWYNENK